MSRLWIRGGRVLDPTEGRDEIADVVIEDGQITHIGPELEIQGAERIEASGQWVMPGFIDMRTHLREPGEEYKEDIASGGRAAAAGGFTAVACMAHTNPVNDDPSVTDYILDRAKNDSPVPVYPIAAATRRLSGETMTEMETLVRAGAVAVSDDNRTIRNGGTMRRVLEYSRLVGIPVIAHAEDESLAGDGVVHEGSVSTRLGLPGNPAVAEASMVARDIMLAELTGAHLHISHLSSLAGVELVREAKRRGVHVTAEVSPHHLTLTDEATLHYDTNAKVLPPLRSQEDRAGLQAALADGTIDAIATDHAPHAEQEKETDFATAPPGMIGLETALAVVMSLVRDGLLSPLVLADRLSTGPARILGVPGGALSEGGEANLAIVAPDETWTYDASKGYSKSKNSPWSGIALTGRVRHTVVAGRLIYDADRGVLVP